MVQSFPITYQNWQFAFNEDCDPVSDSATRVAQVALEQSALESNAVRTQLACAPVHEPAVAGTPRRAQSNSITGNREVMMNRMVDALVGDDPFGAMPEDDSGPVTPPTSALVDSPMIRDLSNSIGALSAADPALQYLPQTEPRKNSTLNANASPFVRSMPSSQDGSWSRQNVASSPSTPYQNPVATHRSSPLLYTPEISSAWHSRKSSDQPLISASQLLSVATSSARPDASSTLMPTMPSAFGTLGDVWGVSSAVPTAEWVRQNQPRYQDGLTSSALFGKRDDRWDSFPTMTPIGQTTSPANGQGG